jgi:hypothetical protein
MRLPCFDTVFIDAKSVLEAADTDDETDQRELLELGNPALLR